MRGGELLTRAFAHRTPGMRMTVRAEQQLVTATRDLQPEFRIEILRDGEVGHDEVEAVQRVDAEFARAPVGFDVVVDRRHRRSSSRSPRTGLVSLATRSFAQMQADDKWPQATSWVTGLTRIPILSISTSTVSPGFMNSGGLPRAGRRPTASRSRSRRRPSASWPH